MHKEVRKEHIIKFTFLIFKINIVFEFWLSRWKNFSSPVTKNIRSPIIPLTCRGLPLLRLPLSTLNLHCVILCLPVFSLAQLTLNIWPPRCKNWVLFPSFIPTSSSIHPTCPLWTFAVPFASGHGSALQVTLLRALYKGLFILLLINLDINYSLFCNAPVWIRILFLTSKNPVLKLAWIFFFAWTYSNNVLTRSSVVRKFLKHS